jgi:hypothetical protein
MSAGARFCPAGLWTAVYQAPSFGFVYVANVMAVPVRISWRAYTASPFWYSDGSTDIGPGERKAIPFGIPTPYVQFEVRPPFDSLLFGS